MEPWSEPLNYDQTLARCAAFVTGRGRFKLADASYSRWYGEKRLLPRLTAQFKSMPIGPLLSVQREEDKEFLEIEKLSNNG